MDNGYETVLQKKRFVITNPSTGSELHTQNLQVERTSMLEHCVYVCRFIGFVISKFCIFLSQKSQSKFRISENILKALRIFLNLVLVHIYMTENQISVN